MIALSRRRVLIAMWYLAPLLFALTWLAWIWIDTPTQERADLGLGLTRLNQPTPHIRARPRAQSLRADRYQILDSEHQIVQVPIQRAMERFVERGMPVRGITAPNATGQFPPYP